MIRRIYLVRHAKTNRKQGEIVEDYAQADIVPFDKEDWYKKTKEQVDIKLSKAKTILHSPIKRCRQTAQEISNLFDCNIIMSTGTLKEFTIPALKKRFSEYTKEEFEELVDITPEEMAAQAKDFLDFINEAEIEDVIAVSHGTFICYLLWYLKGEEDKHLYDVITSQEIDLFPLETIEIVLDDYKLVSWKKAKYTF